MTDSMNGIHKLHSESYMNLEMLFTMATCFIPTQQRHKFTEIHRAANSEIIEAPFKKYASNMPTHVVFATNIS